MERSVSNNRVRAGTTKFANAYFICWIVNIIALYAATAFFYKWVAVPHWGYPYFTSIWHSLGAYAIFYVLYRLKFSLPTPKLEHGVMYNFIRALRDALARPFWIFACSLIVHLLS